jgi:cytochrome c biogenesis protein
MRTALILLLLLALASVAGSLIPQEPNSPERVARFLAEHELLGAFYRQAGLFDVFGSWWFVLITTLLFVSLVACLIPRTRAFVRSLRQRPVQARELDALRHYGEVRVGLDPAGAAAAARRILRRRGFRVAQDPAGAAVAAEKGLAREGGSLLFHWAFILLLAGAIVGKGTGYSGFAVLYEGETWVDALANYDGRIREGRLFGGDYSGLRITLEDYEDRFRTSGQPMDFRSTVRVAGADGAPLGRHEIRVNHPLQIDDLRVFQFGFGWAPTIETSAGGELVAGAEPIEFERSPAPDGISQLAVPWRAAIKLPNLDPQLAIDLELWPDSRSLFSVLQGGPPTPMITVRDPAIRYRVFQGPLTDLSVGSLDTRFLQEVPGASGVIFGGQEATLLEEADAPAGWPEDLSVRFADLRQYSVFQVTRDRGVGVVIGAAILILVGLLPALYVSRRKVWVRAEPDPSGALVRIGGFALQRKDRFEEEFDRLVRDLGELTPQPDRPQEALRP